MANSQQRQDILAAMRKYADMGLPVLPLCADDHKGSSKKHVERCACAGKTPVIKGWTDHTTTTAQQVKTWISEFQYLNIGLPLGHTSGFIGIDVDGVDGEDMLEEISGGDIPDTWKFKTGDGFRLMYEIPPTLITKKHVNIDSTQDHTECSILAYGQQTVLPPSVHHTGRVYEWEHGFSPEDMDCAPAPKWVIDLVRADDAPATRRPGDIDLTSENPEFHYEKPEKKAPLVVSPIIVSEEAFAAEFTNYIEAAYDTEAPTEYQGKEGKAGKKDKKDVITAEELLQPIESGGRDVQMVKIIGHFCAKFRDLGKDYIMLMAKTHNQNFCRPPLDDAAIETKVNHIWEKEETKSAEFSKKREERDKSFIPADVAQTALNLLETEGYRLKKAAEGAGIWMTNIKEGPWKHYHVGGNAEDFQPFLFRALMDPEVGGDSSWGNRRNFGEVASMLSLNLTMAGRVWNVDGFDVGTQSIKDHKYIPLKGGKLLDWQTGELLPWDPETHLTYVIPVDYDPTAKCPNWDLRMSQWLPEEQSRMVIQEFIGYSLIPYMGFEKVLLLQGGGANGKSLMLETLLKMLGKDITASSPMSHLFSRFGKSSLIGKILNIVNEAGADYLRGANADDFKNMVSGGAVIADVKNKDAITFNNTSKFIFSANHDIKTSDKSGAWGRRIILVPFDQNFENSTERKTDIMDALYAEIPGIFNWAVEGLQRLMQNGGFTESRVIAKRMKEYLSRNDIATDFYENCLQKRPAVSVDGVKVERGVPSTVINELFKLWCDYRTTELKKHGERIKDHLEKKGFKQARKTQKHLILSDASKTSCWVNLDVHVTDADFLEYVQTEKLLEITNVKLKLYISERLEELNEEPTPPTPPLVLKMDSEAK